jgi:hypothetical protein
MPSSILHRGLAAAVSLILCHCAAAGEDALKIAIGQRGGWEQCVSELGQNAVAAYRETLDWLYSSPDAIKAYAAWSGLAERLAKQAPVFITRDSLDPIRIVGLED